MYGSQISVFRGNLSRNFSHEFANKYFFGMKILVILVIFVVILNIYRVIGDECVIRLIEFNVHILMLLNEKFKDK